MRISVNNFFWPVCPKTTATVSTIKVTSKLLMTWIIFYLQNSRTTPRANFHFNTLLKLWHPWVVYLPMMTSLVLLSTKVLSNQTVNVAMLNNSFVVEEAVTLTGMVHLQEAPVILIPGHNQVPDPNSATVIQGNEDPYFASTAKRITTSKTSVLLGSKTIPPVSDKMAPLIFLNRPATNNTPMIQVMRVRVECIQFFYKKV